MKRVLITGGAGFIGYHLARKLSEEDCSIDLLDNFSRGVEDSSLADLLKNSSIRILKRDLLNSNDLEKIDDNYDFIYHLAAIIGVQHVKSRPFDVLNLNQKMLLKMLSIAENQKKLEKFIFTSTSEVYSGTLEHFSLQFPTPEDTPLAIKNMYSPRSTYMISKIYGEALCYYSKVPTLVVRPHNFFGPRMGLSHVIPELIKKMYYSADGDTIKIVSPDHKRTFCYIEDAVALLKLLAENNQTVNETYNIGVENPEISIINLARKISIFFNKKINIQAGETQMDSPSRRIPDMTKARKIIDYLLTNTLENGIEKTCEWYINNVFINNGSSAI